MNEIFNREPDTPFTRKEIEDLERVGHNLGAVRHPEIANWAVIEAQGAIRILTDRIRFMEGYYPCEASDNHFAVKGHRLCRHHGGGK